MRMMMIYYLFVEYSYTYQHVESLMFIETNYQSKGLLLLRLCESSFVGQQGTQNSSMKKLSLKILWVV